MKHRFGGWMLPNFARDHKGRVYPIHELDDDEIEWLCDDFKRRVIEKVAKKRAAAGGE